MSPETLIPTYAVVSRHSETCPSKAKGPQYTQCGCRKRISVYDPRVQDPKKRQSYVSTKTRSRADAEIIAQNYRDTHNPDKVRAAEAEAKLKERKSGKPPRSPPSGRPSARFLVFKLITLAVDPLVAAARPHKPWRPTGPSSVT